MKQQELTGTPLAISLSTITQALENPPGGTTSIGSELSTLTPRADVLDLLHQMLLEATHSFTALSAVEWLSSSCVVSIRIAKRANALGDDSTHLSLDYFFLSSLTFSIDPKQIESLFTRILVVISKINLYQDELQRFFPIDHEAGKFTRMRLCLVVVSFLPRNLTNGLHLIYFHRCSTSPPGMVSTPFTISTIRELPI